MQFAADTFETVQENLAADEVALERVALDPGQGILRLWEVRSPAVVLGMGGRWQEEVVGQQTLLNRIPVVRRISGGGTVVLAQGCLNYSLILGVDGSPNLLSPSATNEWIMERHQSLCARLSGFQVTRAGCTDLVVAGRKFSGNAQKRSAGAVLFHGTFLLNMELDLIGCFLQEPIVQPRYREHRVHGQFLANINISSTDLCSELRRLWCADQEMLLSVGEWGRRLARIVRDRYSNPDWNLRR